MTNLNNPAGRLHLLISKALEQSAGLSIWKVWANVFEIEEDDTEELFSKILLVQKLYNDTTTAIEQNDQLDNTLYLKYFPNIKSIFFLKNYDHQWGSLQKPITEIVMYNISVCADLLSQGPTEKIIKDKDLNVLLTDIEKLTKDIIEMQIEGEFKKIIIPLLSIIRTAIIDYKLFGIDEMMNAIEKSIGVLFVRRNIILKEKDNPIYTKLMKVISDVNNLISIAKNVELLAPPVFDNLMGG